MIDSSERALPTLGMPDGRSLTQQTQDKSSPEKRHNDEEEHAPCAEASRLGGGLDGLRGCLLRHEVAERMILRVVPDRSLPAPRLLVPRHT